MTDNINELNLDLPQPEDKPRQILSPLGDSHFEPYVDETGETVVVGVSVDF